VPEILEQELGGNKLVRDFFFAVVLVIAFARLVIIAKDTDAVHHESESILESMAASRKGRWYLPYHHFDERELRNRVALAKH